MAQAQPIPIAPPPGVIATDSLSAIMGRWTLPWQFWIFRNGKPQKIGGWVQAAAAKTSGTPRTSWGWADFQLNKYIAVGTYRKLYAYDTEFKQNDITPYRLSSSGIGGGAALTNPFSTTSGSSIVKVTHASHNTGPGDTVIFTAVAAGVGGITSVQLTAAFVCTDVIDANNYNFDSGVVASSTAGPGGGSVSYNYEINIGSELGAGGYGWGVGTYGQGTWGSARTQTTILFEPRVWALDNFGKLLLASNCPQGSLYQFDPTVSQPWPRATIVPNAPTDIRNVCVTPEQFVFAARESMVLGSSSQGDQTVWTPATNNTAFQRTLTVGAKLVANKVLGPFVTLTWTDAALYKNDYTGSQFVYDTTLEGRDCGLISPNAAVTVAGTAYWMGTDNFWMFSGAGGVQPMPNIDDVRSYVFKRLTQQNGFGCAAIYNPTQDSIWFAIVVEGQTNPTLLVIFHRQEQRYTIHPLTRVSGTHFSAGDTRPYLFDADGTLYQHENGFDANGTPIVYTMTLAPYCLGGPEAGGSVRMLVDGIRCDTYGQIGDLSWRVDTYDALADTMDDLVVEDTETNVVPAPGGILQDFRVGGRFASLTISGSGLGGYARLGVPTLFARPQGKRRSN